MILTFAVAAGPELAPLPGVSRLYRCYAGDSRTLEPFPQSLHFGSSLLLGIRYLLRSRRMRGREMTGVWPLGVDLDA